MGVENKFLTPTANAALDDRARDLVRASLDQTPEEAVESLGLADAGAAYHDTKTLVRRRAAELAAELPEGDLLWRVRDIAADNYSAVKLLAEERPDLLPLVESANRIRMEHGNQFSGSAVLTAARVPRTTNLLPLSRRGIVEKIGESRHRGHRAGYRIVDPNGVARALRELGRL
jgi:hypothetical protein